MPLETFRLGYVPGVTPAKWARTWKQRHKLPLHLVALTVTEATAALAEGTVEAALLRPPIDATTTSAIPLYTEVAVVVAGKEHAVAALDPGEEVTAEDLAGEVFWQPLDEVYPRGTSRPGRSAEYRPDTTAEAIELVAAGTGLLLAPLSLARLHHRRDLIHRPLAGGPPAPVLLAWSTARASDELEDLIGIVRGRTVNSSRGRPSAEPGASPVQATGAGARGDASASAKGGGPNSPGSHRRRPGTPRGPRPGARRRRRR